jgi:hypothetical protein
MMPINYSESLKALKKAEDAIESAKHNLINVFSKY